MSAESYVQVAPDSTGKQIRNLSLTVQATDGTFSTRQMQVVAIANSDGTPVTFSDDIQQQMLLELQRIRLGLQLLSNNALSLHNVRG